MGYWAWRYAMRHPEEYMWTTVGVAAGLAILAGGAIYGIKLSDNKYAEPHELSRQNLSAIVAERANYSNFDASSIDFYGNNYFSIFGSHVENGETLLSNVIFKTDANTCANLMEEMTQKRKIEIYHNKNMKEFCDKLERLVKTAMFVEAVNITSSENTMSPLIFSQTLNILNITVPTATAEGIYSFDIYSTTDKEVSTKSTVYKSVVSIYSPNITLSAADVYEMFLSGNIASFNTEEVGKYEYNLDETTASL